MRLTPTLSLLLLSLVAPAAMAKESARESIIVDNVPAMTITGDKELPQVLYIVPWKSPRLPSPPTPPLLQPDYLKPITPDRKLLPLE